MPREVLVEARERRGPIGRAIKSVFWTFQLLMLLGGLGTCAAVGPFVTGPDPEVAAGAGMFGVLALGAIWTLWPLGTLVLGLLLLATRGRKRFIPLPPAGKA
ncbi:hypothetical protein ACFQS7_06675 [Dankookia sp. GCM10030260]|uniref:hypothetical protein n=1 Tax=Dankookia sp. GCM10030260 TaxID=3273390 RepID=UPI0036065322